MLCPTCKMYYPVLGTGSNVPCIVCGTPMLHSTDDFLGDSPIKVVPEVRLPQLELTRQIDMAIELKKCLVAQAGTGTGKSLALLIPAILARKRAIVSTATVTLQAQYLRDLAKLQKQLDEHGIKFSYAQRKGRGHYFCQKAYEKWKPTLQAEAAARDHKNGNNDACEEFENFRLWAWSPNFGDKADLTQIELEIPKFWSRISAEDCVGSACKHSKYCAYMQSKEFVRSADLIIANHSVVGLNIKLGGLLLPAHTICVFDEAHKAPSMLQKALATELGERAFDRVVDFLTENGVADYLDFDTAAISAAHHKVFDRVRALNARAPDKQTQQPFDIAHIIGDLTVIAAECEELKKELVALAQWVKASKPNAVSEVDAETEIAWQRANKEVVETPQEMEYQLAEQHGFLEKHNKLKVLPDHEAILNGIRKVMGYRGSIGSLAATNETEDVLYLEAPTSDRASYKICQAPIFIGPILKKTLFARVPTVISSSATIPFEWHKLEMGYADDVPGFNARSPFSYGHRVLVYATKKVPIHPDRDKNCSLQEKPARLELYFNSITEEILDLCNASKGCAFVLFSARTEMNEILARVKSKLPFPLKAQTEGSSPIGLEKWFKSEKNPVLFGLRSFWEGVDVQGDQLRLVILPKLPFPLRGDLVLQAKKRALERDGCEDVFATVDVPEMIMHVLQIFGRLIRGINDYGAFAVLDRKFTNQWTWQSPKSYAFRLYNALPTSPDGRKMGIVSDMNIIRQMYLKMGVK